MATRQYRGARYIPVFADPVEWDATRAYEYLTMVQHVGETYMSKQNVPIGAPLPDTEHGEESTQYWVHMSNWNAQVESYRQEVLTYNGRISTLEDDLPLASFSSESTVADAIDSINGKIGTGFDATDNITAVIGSGFDATNNIAAVIGSGFDATNTVKEAISAESLERANQDAIRVITFDNVSSMCASSDISNGSICHTLGFYQPGDNGAAWYIISDSGTANNFDVFAAGDLFAHYVNTGQVNVCQLGAYCDGTHDDSAAFTYAIDNYNWVESKGTAYLAHQIKIPSNKHYVFDHFDSDINDYPVQINTGRYGYIYISSIHNSVGGGIEFVTDSSSTTDTIQGLELTVKFMNTNSTCCKFSNDAGVLDSNIYGEIWQCGTNYALNIGDLNEYIGQMNFKVNRILSGDNYAIYIDTKNTLITGLNFNYCSLEGSNAGIRINVDSTQGHTLEPVRGYFRIVENNAHNKIALKVTGNSDNCIGISEIEFDYFKLSLIDISGFTVPKFYNISPIGIRIIGPCYGNNVTTVTKWSIKAHGLTAEQDSAFRQSYIDQDNDPTSWLTSGLLLNYLITQSTVTNINIPSFWNGTSEMYIQNAVQITANYNYGDASPATITLSPGTHKIVATFNSLGEATLREV